MGEQEIKLTVDENDARDGVTPLLFTIPEAARVLALGRTTIYQLIAAGTLERVHIGRSARVPATALADFVERQRQRRSTVRTSRSGARVERLLDPGTPTT